jgi:hypothetical protein
MIDRIPPVHQWAQPALEAAILERLSAASLHEADIKVEVRGGIARLTGTYARHGDHYAALRIAGATEGISGLRDDLEWARRNGNR